MCRGKVEFIEDMEEKRHALDIIMRHYTKDQFSYSDPAVRNVKVWKVAVRQMTGKVFGLRANEKPKTVSGFRLMNLTSCATPV